MPLCSYIGTMGARKGRTIQEGRGQKRQAAKTPLPMW